MKRKLTVAGLVIATSMIVAVAPSQASMMNQNNMGTGWHMVSKHCGIKPAINWQQYNSGVYLQPVTGKSLFYPLQ